MTPDDGLKLAELLSARICHDLAGPVGAVGTGAELLEEDPQGEMAAEAIALLASSAVAAGARLRFLRTALGAGQAMTAVQLRDTVSTYLTAPGSTTEGLVLDWRDDGRQPWEAGAAKLVLNLVLLARDCLPRGGDIAVHLRPAAGPMAQVAARGRGATPGEAAAALNSPSVGDLSARGVQGYYAQQVAQGLGLRIDRIALDDGVAFLAASR